MAIINSHDSSAPYNHPTIHLAELPEGQYDCWPSELLPESEFGALSPERQALQTLLYARWCIQWEPVSGPADPYIFDSLQGWLDYLYDLDVHHEDITEAEYEAFLVCAQKFFTSRIDALRQRGRADLAQLIEEFIHAKNIGIARRL